MPVEKTKEVCHKRNNIRSEVLVFLVERQSSASYCIDGVYDIIAAQQITAAKLKFSLVVIVVKGFVDRREELADCCRRYTRFTGDMYMYPL